MFSLKRRKKTATDSNREIKKEEPIYLIPEPKVPTWLYKVMIFLCGPTNDKKKKKMLQQMHVELEFCKSR